MVIHHRSLRPLALARFWIEGLDVRFKSRGTCSGNRGCEEAADTESPQRPGPTAVVRERVVSSIPYPTEAEAEDDALAQARELVEQKLAALDPPVRHKPSIGEVKADFVRKDSRTVRPPDADEKENFARYGVSEGYVYVEYDVEVTAEQVRELRSQERVSAGVPHLGRAGRRSRGRVPAPAGPTSGRRVI